MGYTIESAENGDVIVTTTIDERDPFVKVTYTVVLEDSARLSINKIVHNAARKALAELERHAGERKRMDY